MERRATRRVALSALSIQRTCPSDRLDRRVRIALHARPSHGYANIVQRINRTRRH